MPNLDSYLPDFDDLDTMGKASAQAKYEANEIKTQLESYIAQCVRQSYTNQSYWVAGKPPTQSYIENTVKVIGNTPEDATRISGLQEQYRSKWRTYEECRALLDSMKDRISAFQTLSSNKRAGF